MQTGGALTDPVQHTDVRLPVLLPNTRRLPADQALNSNTSGSVEGDAKPIGGPAISLVVPDELRHSLHVLVWQDLQAKNKNFEGAHFISPAAIAAVESADNVQIIVDPAQKVIFIGSAALLDEAKRTKARLTRLLQHHKVRPGVPALFSCCLLFLFSHLCWHCYYFRSLPFFS